MSAEDLDSFDLSRKKKSKKQTKRQEAPNVQQQSEVKVTNNDDFTYEFLLERLIGIVGDKSNQTPTKINLPVPILGRLGSTRTAITNFGSICKILKRPETMLEYFFIVELGTTASIDSNHALILRSRLKQAQVESILKSFIGQYVTCKNCHSPATSIHREDRLTVLKCQSCLSEYTVANIRTNIAN